MLPGDYSHNRQAPRESAWGQEPWRATQAKTLEWVPAAIAIVEEAVHRGKLLTPMEAMALACGEARHDETLYSIALRLSHQHDLDLDILLAALQQRFPGYS